MAEVNKLLSIKHSFTSTQHAMGNGIVERLNGTIKMTLRKLISEQPKEWDRFIVPLLFTLRDGVHERDMDSLRLNSHMADQREGQWKFYKSCGLEKKWRKKRGVNTYTCWIYKRKYWKHAGLLKRNGRGTRRK